MAYTVWTFLCLPDGWVERYPWNKYDQFLEGKAPLDRDVGHAARFVELGLETQGGHPLRMVHASFSRYELRANGFVSAAHQDRRLRDAVESLDPGPAEEKVVPLAPRIARSRLAQEHGWQPGVQELAAIVAAINHAAAKELVRTDGQRLVPP
jgi:hypothetical protein